MKIELIDFGAGEENFLPKRAHYNDAGADVYARETIILKSGHVYKMGLGFGVKIPDGYVGFIFPRSSLSAKGVVCELPPIDSGYHGEIHAVLSNVGPLPQVINTGDRIGQLVVLPCCIPDYVMDMGAERGEGAFGSSGK